MDIVEVISDFLTLKKSGQSYKANSPFTNEQTPSFFVSPGKQIFKCFSSGKGGDSITFVMEHEGFSYTEALKYLAQKYNIEIKEKELTPQELSERTIRDSLFIALNYAKDYFKDLLTNSQAGKSIGLSYFKERGFSEETLDKFDLGYSLDKWDGLLQSGLKKQYSEDILEKAGLIIKKEDGKKYDRFRNRVMFPIHNLAGKVVAFGARILILDKKQPKYINSPETDVYHKSNVLYGLYQAKNEVRNQDNCYLVEGYTDVISLHQAGITNVVASSGTALTKEQIKLIHRYTDNVTVLYDGDAAGIRASIRGIDLILEQGMNVYAVSFPEGEDPDSFVKKIGKERFEKHITDTRRDFISFKTEIFLEDAGTDPIKKAGVIRQIVESIAIVPDPIKRSVFFQKCSNLLKIDEQIIISEFNKIQLKKKTEVKPQVAEDPEIAAQLAQIQEAEEKKSVDATSILIDQESEVVRLLLQWGNKKVTTPQGTEILLCDYIFDELDGFEFHHALFREIFDIYKIERILSDEVTEQSFLKSENKTISKAVIDLISSKYEVSEGWAKFQVYVLEEGEKLEKVAFMMLNRLKWRHVKLLIKNNLALIEQCKTEDDLMDLQTKHIDFKRAEMELARVLGNVTGG